MVRDMISGTCDPRFESVRAEFERNLAERGEVGASVCVLVDGEPVVDVWGGVADRATGGRGSGTRSAWCSRRPRARPRCARTSWPPAGSWT